jgi:2-phospho-L-lactate/phosphoenolpyruvate guanylyltransferase
MSLWAIVPVKTLRRGKSRLAGVLTEDERKLLIQTLLANTLKTLTTVPEVSQTLVVSSDMAALAQARELGAKTVQEDGTPELNMALRRATVVAKVYATDGVLILPADLPLLSCQDIRTILSYAFPPPVVVIVPDRHKDGTNALFVNPAGLLTYSYGPGSFKRHCENAKEAGARLEICHLNSVALDLDMPEDLELLKQVNPIQSDMLIHDSLQMIDPIRRLL